MYPKHGGKKAAVNPFRPYVKSELTIILFFGPLLISQILRLSIRVSVYFSANYNSLLQNEALKIRAVKKPLLYRLDQQAVQLE